MISEISKLSTEDKLLLTSTIFRSGKESLKTDILSCSQTYKNLPAMLNVTSGRKLSFDLCHQCP